MILCTDGRHMEASEPTSVSNLHGPSKLKSTSLTGALLPLPVPHAQHAAFKQQARGLCYHAQLGRGLQEISTAEHGVRSCVTGTQPGHGSSLTCNLQVSLPRCFIATSTLLFQDSQEHPEEAADLSKQVQPNATERSTVQAPSNMKSRLTR